MVKAARSVRKVGKALGKLDAEVAAPKAGAAPVAVATTSTPRVLVVDDSPINAQVLCDAMDEEGWESKATDTLDGVLSFLSSQKPHVILTDVNMPDINGLELVSFIKNNEKYASIPLVIVSTEGSERDREKGLGLGADAYLVKPFDPDDLRRVVTDLLAASGSEG